jgi:diguanylate cyclase (GGDEF)-like protein
MSTPATGILLPADVLTSDWFLLLLTIVAFNTIIYVGLTIAKLVPMPRQIHPRQVRRWTRALGMDPDRDTTVRRDHRPGPVDAADPYDEMRRRIVNRDVPLAFGITGVVVILVATAGLVAFGSRGMALHLIELFAGVGLLVFAQLFALRPFRAGIVKWAWAIACVLIVTLSVVRANYYNSPYPLNYACIIMTAFAPITLYWRPSIAAGLLMLAVLITGTQLTDGGEDVRLIVSALTGLLVSAMLLRLRLKAIGELSSEKARSEELVTTDVLTGALTPRGLLTIMPAIAGIAERTGQQICVMYFSVRDMTKANAQYGVDYGDSVLRAVAKTIQGVVRRGDLVARWHDDEFLVAGIGNKPNAEDLGARIRKAMLSSGVNLGKWPTAVAVGTATGDPAETTFDRLLAEARDDCGRLKAVQS